MDIDPYDNEEAFNRIDEYFKSHPISVTNKNVRMRELTLNEEKILNNINNLAIDYEELQKSKPSEIEYLHKIKKKIELLLQAIINKFNLNEYISTNFRYRLDMQKYYSSKHFEYYKQKKDINGTQLRYGHEYIPVSFADWIETNLPDYNEVSQIYEFACGMRRLRKEDLINLNKISKKYIKEIDVENFKTKIENENDKQPDE